MYHSLSRGSAVAPIGKPGPYEERAIEFEQKERDRQCAFWLFSPQIDCLSEKHSLRAKSGLSGESDLQSLLFVDVFACKFGANLLMPRGELDPYRLIEPPVTRRVLKRCQVFGAEPVQSSMVELGILLLVMKLSACSIS